jgi:ATP-dependent Lon protease
LLEPITSVTTTDISVGLTFDASHVNWIATANDVSRIPASIQSRFKIFHVDLPTTAEVALQCAHTMINAVHKATALSGFVKPGKEVARIIAHLSPRGMRQTLEEAYAIASADGRLKLQGGDFPGLVLEEAGRKSGPVLH